MCDDPFRNELARGWRTKPGGTLTVSTPSRVSDNCLRQRPTTDRSSCRCRQSTLSIQASAPLARQGKRLSAGRLQSPGGAAPLRQYARVHGWIEGAGTGSSAYGTHSMRRTKAVQIYSKTGNLRAVQLLLEVAT
jgi:hypothetical protein